MKTIQQLLLVTVLGLGACAKKDASPKQATATLQDTSWRMTAYTVENKPLQGTGGITFDFFKSYSSNASVPCLGLNTLTFSSSGELLWTQEVGGCAVYPQAAGSASWGKWSLNDSKTQLMVTSKYVVGGNSALPVMWAVPGTYDVIQADDAALILSSKRLSGRQQDSLVIERAVFAPL